MTGTGVIEILVLLITAVAPILAFGFFIYVAVRLAIRHEHRNHER